MRLSAPERALSWLPFQGNVINLRQIHPFFVGADAYIGPKGSIFRPFGMIGKARNWLFPLHETLTPVRLRADVGIGPYGEILRLTALPCRGAFTAPLRKREKSAMIPAGETT